MVKLNMAIESFSPIFGLKKLYDKFFDVTKERVSMLLGVEEEIEKLRGDIEIILNSLHEVEAKQSTPVGLQEWLRQLKDLAYDAEDVLDEFATAVETDPGLARSSDSNPGKKPGKFARLVGTDLARGFSQAAKLAKNAIPFSGGPGRILIRLDIAEQITKIHDSLRVLLERKDMFDLLTNVSSAPVLHERIEPRSRRPQAGSRCGYRFKMVGREKEQKELVKQLINETHTGPVIRGWLGFARVLRSSLFSIISSWTVRVPGDVSATAEVQREKNVSVVAIVGMGGVGKTTLAQLVYQEVSSKFTFKKWLSVGENFNPKFLVEQLIEEDIGNDIQLTDLQDILITRISGKKFLIVLDDVWNTDSEKWDHLWKPLGFGSNGSKVLITCRDRKVVQTTSFKPTIELQPLKKDECLSVFLGHAFPDGDSEKYPDLKFVAKKIVRKLRGLPLAAKVVGGSLFNNFDQNKWNNFLEDELWANVKEGEDNIINQLKWSYNLLPPHLKRCFGYCSIYPKDHKFNIQHDLVLKWMAAGLIQPQGSRRPEDIGMDYFQDLLQKSFFDPIEYFQDEYMMHDLIHDLAELVSSHECACQKRLKTVDNATSLVRHLSLNTFTAGSPYNFQKVRTILYTGRVLSDDLLNRLKYIRILDLGNWRSKISLSDVHAEQISRLKHLRYLKCRIAYTIPESFGELYNLQVLIVEFDIRNIRSEPIRGISKLSKLRILQLYPMTTFIESIGELTALQTLEIFTVGKMDGFGIEELQSLTQLRGKLHIKGLENVETKEKAKKSSIVDKEHLTELVLEWNGSYQTVSPSEQKDILEALQPHPNLQMLNIATYGGEQLPRWLTYASSLSCLELSGCKRLLFYDDNLVFGNLTSLRKLVITRCPQFSDGLCGFITQRVEQTASGSFVLPYFESLTIDNTRLFSTFLGSGDRFCKASFVKEINLRMTLDTGLGLWNENMQTEKLSLFTSLKTMGFFVLGCKDLPSYLHLLPSLETLKIQHSYEVQELPKAGLPKSLQHLRIINCNELALRCREGGPEWEKIKFIPNLHILNRHEKVVSSRKEAEIEIIPDYTIFWNEARIAL